MKVVKAIKIDDTSVWSKKRTLYLTTTNKLFISSGDFSKIAEYMEIRKFGYKVKSYFSYCKDKKWQSFTRWDRVELVEDKTPYLHHLI